MEAETSQPALGENIDSLAQLAPSASDGHALPAKVPLSWLLDNRS